MQSIDSKMASALIEAYKNINQFAELVTEQANIITANVWHIPPQFGSRNTLLDAACALRDAAQHYMQATDARAIAGDHKDTSGVSA